MPQPSLFPGFVPEQPAPTPKLQPSAPSTGWVADVVPLLTTRAVANRTFTYAVGSELENRVQPGHLVRVSFGRQGLVQGIVWQVRRVGDNDNEAALKPIHGLLSPEPLLPTDMLALLQWVADYYGATLAETLQAALPSVVLKQPEPTTRLPQAPPRWYRLGATVDTETASLSLSKRALEVWERLKPPLEASGTVGLPEKDLLVVAQTTKATLQKLQKTGLLVSGIKAGWPPWALDAVEPATAPIELAFHQQQAVDRMAGVRGTPQLLYGVTGSGKTEVYMTLTEQALAEGQTALILVPEISLTGPIARRFAQRFADRGCVVWHSQLSQGERRANWWRMLTGEAKVVIGARSAVFCPLPNLGLLVLDEEHDGSFKQDTPAPRYDARLLAKERARRANARLVLGSATPEVSLFYQAQRQENIPLLELPARYGGRSLPTVEAVDMREERSAGHTGLISRRLAEALHQTIDSGHQAILLLNRRGFHTFVHCADCGHVFQCPDCAVSWTYHKASNDVRCHHCGRQDNKPVVCPQCASLDIRLVGSGTQRLETDLQDVLGPETPLLRLDGDTLQRKHAADQILTAFRDREAPVLIGTQVVAKGLDIANVTLVGILQADSPFYIPEYKAHERGFQLLTQVAGRAGRGEVEGRVILQSWNPDHPVIRMACAQDYEAFYHWDIANRQQHTYPPFCQVIRLICSDEQEERARQFLQAVTAHLKQAIAAVASEDAVQVMGPAPCIVPRLQGRYRFHLLVKNRAGDAVREALVAFYRAIDVPESIRLLLDVDAESLL